LRTCQRAADAFDHVRPIAFGALVKDARICGMHTAQHHQHSKACRHSHFVHRYSRISYRSQRWEILSSSYAVL
jgi:hypothetical protein